MKQLGGTTKTARRCFDQSRLVGCLVATLLMVAGACSSTQEQDPQAIRIADAERSLLAAGNDEDVVRCTINVARPRLKRAPLSELELDELRHSCDEARKALAGPSEEIEQSARPATKGPNELGDDQELDELWRQCEDGDGLACDSLFDQSPTGSTYEQFGVSCGERPEILDCRYLNEPDEALTE